MVQIGKAKPFASGNRKTPNTERVIMKKVKLKQLMNETQFKLSENGIITYIAKGQIFINEKGGLERVCKSKIANTIYRTPYIINVNRFVYVDDETNILVYDK